MTQAGWDLVHAVNAATGVLGMLELPREEVPPEHLWHHDERLEEWFAGVKQAREDRMRGLEPVPDADDDVTADGANGVVVNEMARGLRGA